MADKPTEIPQHQDDPQWIIIWPIDELLPIAILSGVGLLFEQLTICFLIGIGIAKAYKYAKSSRHNGFVLHWLYAHGLALSRSKTMQNTYFRKFIPR